MACVENSNYITDGRGHDFTGERSCEPCECSICYEQITRQCIVLRCLHSFHKECILQYLRTSDSRHVCPNCRQSISNEDVREIVGTSPPRQVSNTPSRDRDREIVEIISRINPTPEDYFYIESQKEYILFRIRTDENFHLLLFDVIQNPGMAVTLFTGIPEIPIPENIFSWNREFNIQEPSSFLTNREIFELYVNEYCAYFLNNDTRRFKYAHPLTLQIIADPQILGYCVRDLEYNINERVRTSLYPTALIFHTYYTNRADTVEELIRLGADVNLENYDGRNALYYAHSMPVVRALLEGGAVFNCHYLRRNRYLYDFMVDQGLTEIVRHMLEPCERELWYLYRRNELFLRGEMEDMGVYRFLFNIVSQFFR